MKKEEGRRKKEEYAKDGELQLSLVANAFPPLRVAYGNAVVVGYLWYKPKGLIFRGNSLESLCSLNSSLFRESS